MKKIIILIIWLGWVVHEAILQINIHDTLYIDSQINTTVNETINAQILAYGVHLCRHIAYQELNWYDGFTYQFLQVWQPFPSILVASLLSISEIS